MENLEDDAFTQVDLLSDDAASDQQQAPCSIKEEEHLNDDSDASWDIEFLLSEWSNPSPGFPPRLDYSAQPPHPADQSTLYPEGQLFAAPMGGGGGGGGGGSSGGSGGELGPPSLAESSLSALPELYLRGYGGNDPSGPPP